MCTSNVYTYVYPDGHKEQSHQPALCSSSRHGQPCSNNVIFQHPSQPVQYAAADGQFPPTPSYTPRSNTPNYRSGDDSDRSRRSSSAGSRQRRSATVYINGQKVMDLNRRDGSASRRERIVLVDGPPTPRTPPQAFSFPHTAPSSPNANINSSPGPSPRESAASFSRRPVIVDDRPRLERPRIQIEVVDTSSLSSHHRRQSSASSHDSRSRSRSSAEEDHVRRRRREREERRAEKEREEQEEEEERQRRIRLRIAKANAEINKRPPVPVPPAPIRASSFSSTAATVGPAYDGAVAELVGGVKHMSFEEERREEKARRLARKQDKLDKLEREEADEAQRQRLAERMMPRRRATVGPGSRRHRVVYDDGVYRWE